MKIDQFIKGLFYSNIHYIKNEFEKRKVNTQQEYDYKHLHKIVHEKAKPCFVLSTGRCGTALLTKIFEQQSNVDVHHAPTPELVYYSKFAYENFKTLSNELKYIIDAARYDQIRNSFLLNKIFVETNNRITFFAYQLEKIYPKAKFIHLIRNPINFIKSGIARNWYTGKNPHDEGHITNFDDMKTWSNYSQTEKIAWLWNETNQFIEGFKKEITSDRVITVFAEDLFNKLETTKNMFSFLDLPPMSPTKIESLVKTPLNKGNVKKIKSIKLQIDENLLELLSLSEYYKFQLKQK